VQPAQAHGEQEEDDGEQQQRRGHQCAAEGVDLVARCCVIEQRFLDPAIGEHCVDQRVEKIPCFGMAQEGELLVSANQIGDQGGETGNGQGEQPKDRLVAKPEGDRIDDQEEERRALVGGAPRLGHAMSVPEVSASVVLPIVSRLYRTRRTLHGNGPHRQ
jgi:hypothetical protein